MARTAKPATRASKKADPKHAKNDNPDAEIEEGAEEDIGRPAPNLALSEVQVETALFRALASGIWPVPEASRSHADFTVGADKDKEMIKLQRYMLHRTGMAVTKADLWGRLNGLYDLGRLDVREGLDGAMPEGGGHVAKKRRVSWALPVAQDAQDRSADNAVSVGPTSDQVAKKADPTVPETPVTGVSTRSQRPTRHLAEVTGHRHALPGYDQLDAYDSTPVLDTLPRDITLSTPKTNIPLSLSAPFQPAHFDFDLHAPSSRPPLHNVCGSSGSSSGMALRSAKTLTRQVLGNIDVDTYEPIQHPANSTMPISSTADHAIAGTHSTTWPKRLGTGFHQSGPTDSASSLKFGLQGRTIYDTARRLDGAQK